MTCEHYLSPSIQFHVISASDTCMIIFSQTISCFLASVPSVQIPESIYHFFIDTSSYLHFFSVLLWLLLPQNLTLDYTVCTVPCGSESQQPLFKCSIGTRGQWRGREGGVCDMLSEKAPAMCEANLPEQGWLTLPLE